jgi:hypothetical protein
MIMMATRNKRKTPRIKAKKPAVEELEARVEDIKSPDLPGSNRPLPKIEADRIFEGGLTNKEERAEIMKLEEISLRKYLEDEPDIYTLEDLKVRYK